MYELTKTVGNYIVYAAALDAPLGGQFIASVVVAHKAGLPNERVEVYRQELIANGRIWQSPNEALACALAFGEEAVCKLGAMQGTNDAQ